MTKPTPERLMAFVDGELDAAEHAAVARAVAADPGLQKLVRVFEATGEPLRPLYGDIAQEAVPDWLLKTVERQVDVLLSGAVVPPPARRGLLEALSLRGWHRAAGVTAAMLVAAGAGFLARGIVDRPAVDRVTALFAIEGTTLAARGPFAAALDSVPAGRSVSLGQTDEDGALTPRFSFVTTNAQVCRQYVLSVPAGSYDGIACRSPGGDGWRIEVHAPAQQPAAAPGDVTQVAEGLGSSPIDGFVSAAIQGDVLGGDEEAKLIADGWRRASR